ncbi:MAG TPA: SEFIR domain-containing protein [Hyalangium sp.]|nr:SEFIR domain-containing protein [Hyalangium sp.]
MSPAAGGPAVGAVASEAPQAPGPARIFISYSHHHESQPERVRQLADRLRGDGFEVLFDQTDSAADAGWPRWMEQQLERADAVILVCTRSWRRRFDGMLDEEGGRGVLFEGKLIRSLLFRDLQFSRFIPVVFEGDLPEEVVPTLFYSHPRYILEKQYASLRAALPAPRAGKAPISSGRLPSPTALPLEPVRFEVALATDEPLDPVMAKLSRTLGASVMSSSDERALAARVVILDRATPAAWCSRVARSPDRALVILSDEAQIPEGAERLARDPVRIISFVREFTARQARRFWWSSGLPLSVAAAAATLVPAVVAAARWPVVGWLCGAAGLLGSGLLIAGTLGAGVGSGTVLLPARARELRMSWTALGATLRVVLGGHTLKSRCVLAIAGFGLAWWPYVRELGDLSRTQGLPLVLAFASSLLLGTVAWICAQKVSAVRVGVLAACVLAAGQLPNLVVFWEVLRSEHWLTVLRLLATPLGLLDPRAWIMASPALSPLSVGGAVVLALVLLPRLGARFRDAGLQRATGGVLLGLAALAVAMTG